MRTNEYIHSLCPVTGLPVLERTDWREVEISPTYQITFKVIDKRILWIISKGDMGTIDIDRLFSVRNQIIHEVIGNTPFVEIRSYKDLHGLPTSDDRKKQTQNWLESPGIFKGLIVHNASFFIGLIYQTAKRFVDSPHSVDICRNYEEAVKKALQILDNPSSDMPDIKLIARNINDKVNKRDLKSDPIISIRQSEINKLIETIGTLFWDSGVKISVPTDSPISKIFQLIDLLRNDLYEALTLQHAEQMQRKQRELELENALAEAERTKKELQEQTIKANELAQKAELANTAKGQFLANMSHEIRTPMNGIIGMNAILLETNLTQEQRMFSETIKRSADSLLAILNDILDFSKIEAGKLTVEETPFNLKTLLNDLAMAANLIMVEKGLRFSNTISPEIPADYIGDPVRIGQIINNLISNANKFTDKGEISLLTECVLQTETHCTLRFIVKDSGIGIPENARFLLFQSFTQADASTTRKYGGTGLGLAICKKLVELMHGEIGFTSIDNEGSTFWFTVLLKKNVAQPLPLLLNPNVTVTKKLSNLSQNARILLVEDNYTNRQLATLQLRKFGFAADVAENGQIALDLLSKTHYDLVLMDCQMPVLDGYETTKVIRNNPKHQNHQVPIIAMTANAMLGDREKCLEAGMDDYLSKPISLEMLSNKIDQWIQKKSHVIKKCNETPINLYPENRLLIFDFDALKERLLGDQDAIQKIITLFMKDFPERLSVLRNSLNDKNITSAIFQAHSIKGACLNIGAITMGTIAQEMDRAGKEGSLEAIERLFPKLENEFSKFVIEIKKFPFLNV
jgi:signal transduction histidine kinase/CheY-like chemotaxis protein/HPt (histidine-containing phosphotransfer) domain-containing protein